MFTDHLHCLCACVYKCNGVKQMYKGFGIIGLFLLLLNLYSQWNYWKWSSQAISSSVKYNCYRSYDMAMDSRLGRYSEHPLLGNFGDLEGPLYLCADALITLFFFCLSHMQIWPAETGEWESNRTVLFPLTNRKIKQDSISASLIPETVTALVHFPSPCFCLCLRKVSI